MADYKIRNLKELDDAAVGFGLSPDMEARFARRALEAERGGLSYQRLAPGFRQPFGHHHTEQEEIYVVLGGSGRIKVGDEIHDLAPWDAVRVSATTTRQFEAGPDGLEYLAFGAGNEGEAETVSDWWTD